jgi:Protein of unknown function (DUF2510)
MVFANFSSPFYIIFGLLIGFMNYRNTERYRRATGHSPWGVPPIVWGVASVFLSLVVTILALIAMNTGRGARRAGGTGRMFGAAGMYGRGPATGSSRPPFGGQVPGPPTAHSPGEYPDTSLRPHPSDQQSEGAAPATLTSAPTAPPSWQPDPSGRFDFRYWGGEDWTEFVSKDGEQSVDPF